MAARNRKRKEAQLSIGSWVKALSFCVVLGGLAMGYVWQKSQIHQIGILLNKKEVRLELLKGENERWSQMRAEMRSTQKLYERVNKLGLGLMMPTPEQVLKLSDLTPEVKELERSEVGEYRTVKQTPIWGSQRRGK
ncbi:MAG: hypothetical protein EVA72_01670 [Limisphaerales bacterium]|jgi:cell division protein FtsL|nr:hypothetical protein [Verrucomicrobiales bacterium]RZO60743.1 MAG: hypothetical protein EVA72_01670 [Limisphaerales bacterium]|tara:strand:- start:3169 stop:3576 length:408 start_codon:yes stop_codon:yes gene_type:complete